MYTTKNPEREERYSNLIPTFRWELFGSYVTNHDPYMTESSDEDEPNRKLNPSKIIVREISGDWRFDAQSEVNFRLPEDLDLASESFDAPSGSFEEIGSGDDLFSTYLDMEKLGSSLKDGDGVTDGFGYRSDQ